MTDGTQEGMAKAAGRLLKTAQDELETAGHAPMGPRTKEALKKARQMYEAALQAFDSAYTTYSTHMINHHQSPRNRSWFITD